MPINKDKNNCSGCTACASICPVSCISMAPDELGFKYPKVDIEKCIDCDLCVRTCPFDDNYKTPNNFESPITYVGRSKNISEVEKSQSGAAFVVLSNWILDDNGVVYGVGYGENFKVKHKRVTTKEERDGLRGSKYVQSDLNDIFIKIKTDLIEDKRVLFTGTPCQVAGLQAFIPAKLKENLYVVDIICHGVPGPKLWEDFVSFLQKKEKAILSEVKFRDKSLGGWHGSIESFKYENSNRKIIYPFRFYSNFNLRYSCESCPFTNTRRAGDITIGDAWGIEKSPASHLGEDGKGCSIFLINTKKGKELFNSIEDKLLYEFVEIEPFLQPQLCHPSSFDKKREQFEEDYIRSGFKYVMYKYYIPPLYKRIFNPILRLIPKKIRQAIIKNLK